MAIAGDSLPPPRLPIRKYSTPALSEGFFTERVDITAPDYAPIKRGTKYSSIPGRRQDVVQAFPDLYFLREIRDPSEFPWATQLWATDTKAEDSYNAAVEYIAQDVNYPAFTRVYTVRRDLYDNSSPIPLGSPLTGLIGVSIVSGGSGYTQATGTVGNATVEFVVGPDGSLISGIVLESGSGIVSGQAITITGDGTGAFAQAIVQPPTAILTSQKKHELQDDHPLRHEYVLVTRVYETLPGPPIASTRIDNDGVEIDIVKTRKVAATITTSETVTGGVWVKTYKEQQEDSDFVATEVVEARTVPGNPVASAVIDPDGAEVTITKTLKALTDIHPSETVSGGVWTEITSEPLTDLVAHEVVRSRPVPGNPIVMTRVDEDGAVTTISKVMKPRADIVPGESIVGGIWRRVYQEDQPYFRGFAIKSGDLVSWEVTEDRPVPGNPVPASSVNSEEEIVTITRTIKPTASITPSATESGGIITTVEKTEVSDLVSREVVSVRPWLDKAEYEVSILNIIPEKFRAQIKTVTESHIVAGTASLPTLASGQFAHTQRQLTKLLYEDRVTTLGNITFPITFNDYETTTRYGGGILLHSITLDSAPMSVDEGHLVVESTVTVLGNGLYLKSTLSLNDTAWPITYSAHVDEKYGLKIITTKQVKQAGVDVGGVSGSTYIDVQAIDKWRSITIASALDPDSLPAPVQWFSSQHYSFPPELLSASMEWAEAFCGCSSSFSVALVANVNQYSGQVKTRITEQFFNGPPPDDVSPTQFFPQAHHFGFAWSSACGSDDSTCRTKSGAPEFHLPLALHPDLTLTLGVHVWTFGATTPPSLPHGSYITLKPYVERWRFGVFHRIITEVLVP